VNERESRREEHVDRLDRDKSGQESERERERVREKESTDVVKMCDFDVWTYLARLGVKSRLPSDAFFSDGDAVCQMRTCTYLTQEDEEEFLHTDYAEFPCSAPGCGSAFSQVHRRRFFLPFTHVSFDTIIQNHEQA
jgi:hypothetical protein